MRRFVVFDRQGGPMLDLDGRVSRAVRTERLNGEHKLELTTTQLLEEGMRLVVRDAMGTWREWVVDEVDELHTNGKSVEGTYGCTWSIQYDLATVDGGELWPGTYDPTTAALALGMVLGRQSTWEVGNVTVTGTNGTTLFDGQVWDYIGQLVETWGGEVEPRIVVTSAGVTHRYVDWLAHVGSETVKRRFDYGHDCTGIRRKAASGPRYCRIVPRGGHDATDADGIRYSERVGVEEEPYSSGEGWVHNAGSKWVRDPEAEAAFRVPDGRGGWRYPELVVTYDTDDPEELLLRASADIHGYTRPQASYEVDVMQMVEAGTDAHGVALGDEVHVVDTAFGSAPLRMQARVTEVEVDELDESNMRLVIGEAVDGLEAMFSSMRSAIDRSGSLARLIEGGGSSTLVYLKTLLDQLNAEINATGGYVYVTDGDGLLTYDKKVSDPKVGAEATRVVEIKGGSIRIADSKTASGAWDWRTVFVSGHVAAELVTAVNVVTGWLGNAGGTYIDLDNNTANFGPTGGYHFTVDLNGIRHWHGTTLLGQHLKDSMQLGKSNAAHLVANTSGIELFDANNVSEASFNASGARMGRVDGTHIDLSANHINMVGSESGGLEVLSDSERRYPTTIWDSGSLSKTKLYAVTGEVVADRLRSASFGTKIAAICMFGNHSRSEEFVYGTSKSTIVNDTDESTGLWIRIDYDGVFTFRWQRSTSVALPIGILSHLRYEASIPYHIMTYGISSTLNTDRGSFSSVLGFSLYAPTDGQLSFGMFNMNQSGLLMSAGNGDFEQRRSDSLRLTTAGNLWIAGTLTQNSDRRLKEHHAYLGEDACDFVRALKPALYTKDGERHVGFYAQDVRDAEPDGWDTVTVAPQHTDESLDFDPLTLDYSALIAPLVAYAQSLERRIDRQQEVIEDLTSRIEALEAR